MLTKDHSASALAELAPLVHYLTLPSVSSVLDGMASMVTFFCESCNFIVALGATAFDTLHSAYPNCFGHERFHKQLCDCVDPASRTAVGFRSKQVGLTRSQTAMQHVESVVLPAIRVFLAVASTSDPVTTTFFDRVFSVLGNNIVSVIRILSALPADDAVTSSTVTPTSTITPTSDLVVAAGATSVQEGADSCVEDVVIMVDESKQGNHCEAHPVSPPGRPYPLGGATAPTPNPSAREICLKALEDLIRRIGSRNPFDVAAQALKGTIAAAVSTMTSSELRKRVQLIFTEYIRSNVTDWPASARLQPSVLDQHPDYALDILAAANSQLQSLCDSTDVAAFLRGILDHPAVPLLLDIAGPILQRAPDNGLVSVVTTIRTRVRTIIEGLGTGSISHRTFRAIQAGMVASQGSQAGSFLLLARRCSHVANSGHDEFDAKVIQSFSQWNDHLTARDALSRDTSLAYRNILVKHRSHLNAELVDVLDALCTAPSPSGSYSSVRELVEDSRFDCLRPFSADIAFLATNTVDGVTQRLLGRAVAQRIGDDDDDSHKLTSSELFGACMDDTQRGIEELKQCLLTRSEVTMDQVILFFGDSVSLEAVDNDYTQKEIDILFSPSSTGLTSAIRRRVPSLIAFFELTRFVHILKLAVVVTQSLQPSLAPSVCSASPGHDDAQQQEQTADVLESDDNGMGEGSVDDSDIALASLLAVLIDPEPAGSVCALLLKPGDLRVRLKDCEGLRRRLYNEVGSKAEGSEVVFLRQLSDIRGRTVIGQMRSREYLMDDDKFCTLLELMSANPRDGLSGDMAASLSRLRPVLVEGLMGTPIPTKVSQVMRRLRQCLRGRNLEPDDILLVHDSLDTLEGVHTGLRDDSSVNDMKIARNIAKASFTRPNLDVTGPVAEMARQFLSFSLRRGGTPMATKDVEDLRDRLHLNTMLQVDGAQSDSENDFVWGLSRKFDICLRIAQLRVELGQLGAHSNEVMSYFRGASGGPGAVDLLLDFKEPVNHFMQQEEQLTCQLDSHNEELRHLMAHHPSVCYFTVNQLLRLHQLMIGDGEPSDVQAGRALLQFACYDLSVAQTEQLFLGWSAFDNGDGADAPLDIAERLGAFLDKKLGPKLFSKRLIDYQCFHDNVSAPSVVSGTLNLIHRDRATHLQDLLQLFADDSSLPRASQILFCSPATTLEEILGVIWRCRHGAAGALASSSSRSLPGHACLGAATSPSATRGLLHVIVDPQLLPTALQEALARELQNVLLSSESPIYRFALLARPERSVVSDYLHDYQREFFPATVEQLKQLYTSMFCGADSEAGLFQVFQSHVEGAGKTYMIHQWAHTRQLPVTTVLVHQEASVRHTIDRILSTRSSANLGSGVALHLNIAARAHRSTDELVFCLAVLRQLRLPSGLCATLSPADVLLVEMPSLGCAELQDAHPFLAQGNPLPRVMTDPVTNPLDISSSSQFAFQAQYVLKFLRGLAEGRLSSLLPPGRGGSDMDPIQEPAVTIDEAMQLLGAHEINLRQGIIRASCFIRYMYEQLQQVEASVFLKMEFAPWFPGEHAGVRGIRDIVVENLIESAKDFAFASLPPAEDPAVGVRGQVGFPVISRWNEMRRPLLVFNQTSAHATGGHGDFTLLCQDSRQLQGADIPHWKAQPSVFVDFGVAERQQDSQENKRDKIDLLLRIFDGAGVAHGPQRERLVDRLMQTEFALTYDNVLKMAAIYIRQKAGIPCLLEGESGCGKTRLIQYLADILNITLVQADVHGGFTEVDVLTKVDEARAQADASSVQTVWLFFDEINTAPDVMGMFKEILCDRQCLGEDLPSNLSVMAACNPHRYFDPNAPERGNRCAGALDRKHLVDRYSRSGQQLPDDPLDDRNLVYRVVPLPRTLSQYRWTFGCLSDHDEELYVSEMVMQSVTDRAAQKFLVECILRSHRFLRGRGCYGDISAVSLRDAARCVKLYRWWVDRNLPTCSPRSAAILAVALTYYFRLKNSGENHSLSASDPRQELARGANEVSNRCFGSSPHRAGFEDILLSFQNRVASMLTIPEGIAKNAVLLENIFVVFACVQNRIPVIVVGEPGCSKTLSVQLMFKHSSALEKAGFAKMYPVPFQCSRLSTATAIAERFQFAVDFQKKQVSSDALSVMWLDEVGLAEQSEHRPLKVLHRLLEHPEVSFIGLSNWQLDAAKMNRMVLHTCPKLFRNGLIDTAVTIITEGMQNATTSRFSSCTIDVKNVVKNIVDAYFRVVREQPHQYFFGRRDLYSTLQQLARNDQFSCPDARIRNDAVVRAFERNFGGGDDGHRFIHDVLARNFECERIRNAIAARGSAQQGLIRGPSPSILIRDSLVDFGRPGKDGKPSSLNPRNVMCLTTDEMMWRTLLQNGVFGADPCQVEVLIGSQFPGDIDSALSVYERVNTFRRCMQTGQTVVLVNCDDLYGSLYACLNLQYQTYAGRKWCNIALGAESMKVRVHEDFKVVVVVSAAEAHGGIIPRPFLNRFEKQFVCRRHALADVDRDHCSSLVGDVTARLKRMLGIGGSDFQQQVQDAFPGAAEETVASAIISAGEDASVDSVLEMMIWSMTPETAAVVADEVFDAYFRKQVHAHLPALLSTLLSDPASFNLIVRTYSFEVPPSILERELNRDAPLTGCIAVVPLRHHQSSVDFVDMLEMSLRHGSADDLLVITLPETEVSVKHISHIMHLIDKTRRAHKSDSRVVCLVHLDRKRQSQPSVLPLLFEPGWPSVFIDSVIQPGLRSASSWSDILRSPLFEVIPRRVSVEDPRLKDVVRRALSVLAYPTTVDVIGKLHGLQALVSESAKFCEAIQSVVGSLCSNAHYTAADVVLERQPLSPFLASILNSNTSAATATRTGSFFERLNAVVDDSLCACMVQILRVLDVNDNLSLACCSGPIKDLWYSWLQVLTSAAITDMSIESQEPLRAGHRVTVTTEFSSRFPFSCVLFGHTQALLEEAREFDEQLGCEMLSAGLSGPVPAALNDGGDDDEDLGGFKVVGNRIRPEADPFAADSLLSVLGTRLSEDLARRYVQDALAISGVIKLSSSASGITPNNVATRLVEYVLDSLLPAAESVNMCYDWVDVPLVDVHRAVVESEATLVGLNAFLCALHSAGVLGADQCTPGEMDSWLVGAFGRASDVVVDDTRTFVTLVDALDSRGISDLLNSLHVSHETHQVWSALRIRGLCATVLVAMEDAGAGANAVEGPARVLPLCDAGDPSLGRIVNFIGPIINDVGSMGVKATKVLRACSAVICRFTLDFFFIENTPPSPADLSLILALVGESGPGDNDLKFDISMVCKHIQPLDRQRIVDALVAMIVTEDCRKKSFFASVENMIEPFLGDVWGRSLLVSVIIRSFESRLSVRSLQQSSGVLLGLVADESVLQRGRVLSCLLAIAAARCLIGGCDVFRKFVEWPLPARRLFSDSPPELIPGIQLFWARRVFRDLGLQHFSERARDGWWPFMADSDVKSCQTLATIEMDGGDPFVVLGESYASLAAKVLSGAAPTASANVSALSASSSAPKATETVSVSGIYVLGCVAISLLGKRGVTKRSLNTMIEIALRTDKLLAPHDELCRLAANGVLGLQESPVISRVFRHWTIALWSTNTLHTTSVGMLVHNPEIFNNGYVPGMPNDHLAHVRGGTDIANAAEFTCPNGHSFFVGECRQRNQVGICPECRAQIGGHGVGGVHQRNGGGRAVQGLVLEAGRISHEGAGEREMTRTEELIVRLIVCLTLAGGLQSRTSFRRVSALVGQQPERQIHDQIRGLFGAVCRALARPEESVRNLLHMVIHRCTTVGPPPQSGDASEASRGSFEQWFVGQCCRPILRNPGESIASLSQSSLSCAVARELDTEGGGRSCNAKNLECNVDNEYTELLHPHLWHLNPPPMSLASFQGSLAAHSKNDPASFGPLLSFLKGVENMELIRDFTALAEWHMWVWRQFSRKHTRQHMKDMTVQAVLVELPSARSLWVRFENVWNRISKSSVELYLECQKVPIPEISASCSLLLTVAADKASAKHLLVLVENLVVIHNRFLSQLQEEAAKVPNAVEPIRVVRDIVDDPVAIDVCGTSQAVQLDAASLLAIIRRGMYFDGNGSCAFDFHSIQHDVLKTFVHGRRHIFTRLPKLRFRGEVNFSAALSKKSGVAGQQEDLSIKVKHVIVAKLETIEAVEAARVVLEECILFPVMSCDKSLFEFATETLKIEASRVEFLVMPDRKDPPVMPHHLAALSRLLDQRLSGLDPTQVPGTLPAYSSQRLTTHQRSLLTTMMGRLESAQKTLLARGLWQFLRDYGKEEMSSNAPLKVYLDSFEADVPQPFTSQQQPTTFGDFEWFAQHFPDQDSAITLALAVDVYRFMVGGGDGKGQRD